MKWAKEIHFLCSNSFCTFQYWCILHFSLNINKMSCLKCPIGAFQRSFKQLHIIFSQSDKDYIDICIMFSKEYRYIILSKIGQRWPLSNSWKYSNHSEEETLIISLMSVIKVLNVELAIIITIITSQIQRMLWNCGFAFATLGSCYMNFDILNYIILSLKSFSSRMHSSRLGSFILWIYEVISSTKKTIGMKIIRAKLQ